jgi:hypothetical protein
MIDVRQVRRCYPAPREPRFDDNTPQSYCVGGALAQFLGAGPGYRFPVPGDIASYLRSANPFLDAAEAEQYAHQIVWCNDAARFDAAWTALQTALEVERREAA